MAVFEGRTRVRKNYTNFCEHNDAKAVKNHSRHGVALLHYDNQFESVGALPRSAMSVMCTSFLCGY